MKILPIVGVFLFIIGLILLSLALVLRFKIGASLLPEGEDQMMPTWPTWLILLLVAGVILALIGIIVIVFSIFQPLYGRTELSGKINVTVEPEDIMNKVIYDPLTGNAMTFPEFLLNCETISYDQLRIASGIREYQENCSGIIQDRLTRGK